MSERIWRCNLCGKVWRDAPPEKHTMADCIIEADRIDASRIAEASAKAAQVADEEAKANARVYRDM